MDSTSQSFTKAKISEERSVAKAGSSRGISARACAAKTMTWELDSAKGVLVHDASISNISLPQVMWEAQDNHQINENHKKMLE